MELGGVRGGGRGDGEGVNRYVTAPEALCAQVGGMPKYHFRHHLEHHLASSLLSSSLVRGLALERCEAKYDLEPESWIAWKVEKVHLSRFSTSFSCFSQICQSTRRNCVFKGDANHHLLQIGLALKRCEAKYDLDCKSKKCI